MWGPNVKAAMSNSLLSHLQLQPCQLCAAANMHQAAFINVGIHQRQ
jgi:hypothetical protein